MAGKPYPKTTRRPDSWCPDCRRYVGPETVRPDGHHEFQTVNLDGVDVFRRCGTQARLVPWKDRKAADDGR